MADVLKNNGAQGPDKKVLMFEKLLLAQDKGYGLAPRQNLSEFVYNRHFRQYSYTATLLW